MVINDLSRSSFKLQLLTANLLNASRWQSFRVVGGRQRYFVLFPGNDTNEMTGSLGRLSPSFTVAEIDLESIPATQSLTVYEGCYWPLQSFHSCFHVVAHSF